MAAHPSRPSIPAERIDVPDPDRAELDLLRAVSTRLERHGRRPVLTAPLIDGEPEVRLVVAGTTGGVTVEVLGPCAAAPLHGWWFAVRCDADGRTVWRGPARSSCPERADEVVRFVENLLACHGAVPDPTGYTRLG